MPHEINPLMNTRLLQFWSACSPAARVAWLIMLSIGAAVLYAVLVYSAEQSRARLKTGISELRVKSADMEKQASEISRLRAMASTATHSGMDFPKTVQALVDSNGLATTAKINHRDAENIELVLGNLPFAQWLAMARSLQAQQIRIESCKVEGLAIPGMVSISATLTRPRTR